MKDVRTILRRRWTPSATKLQVTRMNIQQIDPRQWEVRELLCDDGVRRLAAVYKPTGEATLEPEIVISVTAAGILRARENHPDMTLAQMYDDVNMPGDLRTAHQLNDRAVMEAYGLPPDATEAEIVAELMRRYRELKEAEHASERA